MKFENPDPDPETWI